MATISRSTQCSTKAMVCSYPVCGMVHIKEPLLLIGKSSQCGGSGLPISLSEWSLTICLTPYVLSAALNKTFPSFFRGNIKAEAAAKRSIRQTR